MKVLWFAITPSLYIEEIDGNFDRGWVASLESIVKKDADIELAVAFEHPATSFKEMRNGVTYYPMNVWESRFQRIKRKLIYKTEELRLIPECLKIIDDFRPDIIQVFGSEWCFGLVQYHTKTPVVIHMQGSILSHNNAKFPPGYNILNNVLYNGLHLYNSFRQILADREYKLRAKREERILRGCIFFMGRTEWDKNLTRLYAPDSKYFYCSEALRSPFTEGNEFWKPKNREKIIIVSTINAILYKGFDTILKTAKLLKETSNLDFEWRLLGSKLPGLIEKKEKIKHSDVNVIILGLVSAEIVKKELLNCDVYVHPSYIDNSPNAVCEAQYLGVPVIATYVGGTPSLIKHNETGVFVPVNDPFSLASIIKNLKNNIEEMIRLGNNARQVAKARHNEESIITDLKSSYKYMITKNNC